MTRGHEGPAGTRNICAQATRARPPAEPSKGHLCIRPPRTCPLRAGLPSARRQQAGAQEKASQGLAHHPPRRSALSLPPHTKDASRPSPHTACPVSESERARAGKDERKRENRLRTPFPPQLVWKGVVGSHKRELDRKVTRRGHFSGTVAYALGWNVGCPCCCCVLPVDYSSWGKDVGKGEPVKTPRWPKIEDLEGAGGGASMSCQRPRGRTTPRG